MEHVADTPRTKPLRNFNNRRLASVHLAAIAALQRRTRAASAPHEQGREWWSSSGSRRMMEREYRRWDAGKAFGRTGAIYLRPLSRASCSPAPAGVWNAMGGSRGYCVGRAPVKVKTQTQSKARATNAAAATAEAKKDRRFESEEAVAVRAAGLADLDEHAAGRRQVDSQASGRADCGLHAQAQAEAGTASLSSGTMLTDVGAMDAGEMAAEVEAVEADALEDVVVEEDEEDEDEEEEAFELVRKTLQQERERKRGDSLENAIDMQPDDSDEHASEREYHDLEDEFESEGEEREDGEEPEGRVAPAELDEQGLRQEGGGAAARQELDQEGPREEDDEERKVPGPEDSAALVVQCATRGWLARCMLIELKEEDQRQRQSALKQGQGDGEEAGEARPGGESGVLVQHAQDGEAAGEQVWHELLTWA